MNSSTEFNDHNMRFVCILVAYYFLWLEEGCFLPLHPDECGSLKGGAYHYGTSIYYTDIFIYFIIHQEMQIFMPLADSAGFFY